MTDTTTLLDDLAKEIRETNIANGWYEDERTVGDDIALLHSEASEMLEAYRDTGLLDATGYCNVSPDHGGDHLCKPEGFGAEAADVLIRLIDTCDRRGIDLLAETRRKMAYNATRGYRHGGKRL